MPKLSVRTHRRVENKYCRTCGTKTAHEAVESKRGAWVILVWLFTSFLAAPFLRRRVWKWQCTQCNTLN